MILGTVKFGDNSYGYSNSKQNEINLNRFLEKLYSINVNKLDTSPRYGLSEKIIGEYNSINKNKFLVSTKVDKLKPNDKKSVYNIAHSLEKSLKNLNLDSIEIFYLHQNNLEIISDKYIINTLADLKSDKSIKSLGVSVYTHEECAYAVDSDLYDYIQIPINIFDTSFYDKFVVNNNKKVKFIARSILFQGLVTNKNFIKKHIFADEIINYLKRFNNNLFLDLTRLSVAFVNSLPGISDFIVGSLSIKNIKKNIQYSKIKLPKEVVNEILFHSKKMKYWTNIKNWNAKIH